MTPIGTIIDGRYEVLSMLGEGGMGTVFKARQLDIGRMVAIKILHAQSDDDDNFARFMREAGVLYDLVHPNLPNFYHVGRWQQTLYMVIEYLDGASLRSILDRESKLSEEKAVEIAMQVCSACIAAHERGVIHRDIKPNNIFLLSQAPAGCEVRVIDFGLAKLLHQDPEKQKLTNTGMLIGSVHYMSPEQCRGQSVDQQSDIYSLGCVLFEMLAGHSPLEADNPIGLLHKHINEEPDYAVLRKHTRFAGLEAVLRKSMAKHREERYRTMTEFMNDLELVATNRGAEVKGHASKKRKGYIVFSSMVLVYLTLIAAVFFAYSRDTKPVESLAPSPVEARLHRIEQRINDELGGYLKCTTEQCRIDVGRGLYLQYMEAAQVAFGLNQFPRARDYIEKSLKFSGYGITPELNLSQAHSAFGRAYFEEGNLPLALEHFQKAEVALEKPPRANLDPAMKIRHTSEQARTRSFCATIYARMGRLADARREVESGRAIVDKVHEGNQDPFVLRLDCDITDEYTRRLLRWCKPDSVQDKLDAAAIMINQLEHMANYCAQTHKKYPAEALLVARRWLADTKNENLPEWSKLQERLERVEPRLPELKKD